MFLVNAPPLLAFKTTWAPFGQTAAGKLPVSFSESEEDISGTSITAQVQGIITNLQSDESSLDVTSDYEGIMQKNRKGEIHIDKGLTSSAVIFKGHSRESATLVVPAQFKDNKEERSGCGPLVLESDSDDSVDRDIEEAIQEYLKKKGTSDSPSNPENAKSLVTTEKERALPSVVQNPSSHACPSGPEAKSDFFDGFRQQNKPRSASPESVSSDDSFEQSIKHEIEQFLQEKKQQNIANETGKKDGQVAAAVKPKPKPNKAPEKANIKHGSRDPPGKPLAVCVGTQAKSLKTNSDGLKNAPDRIQPKASACRPSKNAKVLTKEAVKSPSEALSDSSSDDGIEEAIQLYQLEKSRQECNLKIPVVVSPERLKAKPQVGLNINPSPDKILQVDDCKKPENRKRKLPAVKPPALRETTHCQPVSSKRAFFARDNQNPKCDTAGHATRCAETSAELMCAEAILDISKTILPSQPESTLTVRQANSSSSREADSDSAVDSDDSIEQEIRTFLARKAEAESASTAFAKQEPALPELKAEPDSQSPVSKTKPCPVQKRKAHENKPVQQGQMTQVLEKLTSSNVNVRTDSNKHLLPSETVENSCMRTGTYVVARAKPPHPSAAGITAGHHVMDVKNVESSVDVRSPCKTNLEERDNYSGDESSSLDSDEDLDTAIKDLLKSKKKCKKKVRDTRSPCKKRVRFGESTCKVFEPYGTEQRSDHGAKAPPNKSCFVSTSPTKETSARKLKSSLKGKEDRDKAANANGEPNVTCASVKTEANVQPCAFSQDQDSSSVDSDDSIEQEIRKFLAERARESAELTAAQQGSGGPHLGIEDGKPTQTAIQGQGVSSNAVAETSSQSSTNFTSVMTPRHEAAAAPKPSDCKLTVSPVGQLHHHPTAAGCSPVPKRECLMVNRECILSQSNVLKQSEGPGRAALKSEMNGSQVKSDVAVSGSFVAGLKYISGDEKQLVLNVGRTGNSRLTGGYLSQQTSCQPVAKKGLLLEKAKVAQTPVSTKTPLVCPGLYVLTTQVCKENSALCLPINAGQYETGINLMSLPYCHGQVATRVLPLAGELRVQQPKSGDNRKQSTTNAGGISSLTPQTHERERRPSQSGESASQAGSGRDTAEGRRSQEKEQLSSFFSTRIDPGLTIEPYIMLSPEQICNQFGLRRPHQRKSRKENKVTTLPSKSPAGHRRIY